MERVAVITGAASGVGRETVELLTQEFNYKVIGVDWGHGKLWDGNTQKVKDFLSDPLDRILSLHLDVTEERLVMAFWAILEAAIHEPNQQFPGPEMTVDLLVNCAGISLMQWSEYIDMEEFRKVLDVNLIGSFSMATAFFRSFYGHDFENEQTLTHTDQTIRRVVNLGSLGSKQFFRGGVAYVASKAGVEAMTRVMAKEHVKHYFKFFCIQPETLEGESQIAGYIKRRLQETRGEKEAEFYGIGEIKSQEEAEGYFYGTNPQTTLDIAKIIGTITTGDLDPLNGSALECLDGRS